MSTTTLNNLHFYLNGVEVSVENNFDIQLNSKNKSTFRFQNVHPLNDDPTKLFVVEDYSNLTITNQSGEKLFSGIVKLTSNQEISHANLPKWVSFQAVDNKEWLSSGEPVTFIYRNTTLETIVTDLINRVAKYGFHIGRLYFKQNPPIIEKVFSNAKVYDILNWISEVSNSKWSANDNEISFYYFDEDGVSDYCDVFLSADDKSIIFNPNVVNEEIPYKINWQGARVVDYLNQITIQSNNLISSNPRTQTISPDGTRTVFNLQMPVFDVISVLLSRDGINWVYQSVANDDDQEIIHANWYYKRGEAFLYQNEDDQPISSNEGQSRIKVIYNTIGFGRFTAQNDAEAMRIAHLQGSEEPYYRNKTITKNDITSNDELVAYANYQLEKYSKPYRPLTFYFKEPWDECGKLNQLIKINLSDKYNNSPKFLETTYFINQIMIKGDKFSADYIYVLTPTLNDDQAINFYDDRLRVSENTDNLLANQVVEQNWNIEFNPSQSVSDNPGIIIGDELPTTYQVFLKSTVIDQEIALSEPIPIKYGTDKNYTFNLEIKETFD